MEEESRYSDIAWDTYTNADRNAICSAWLKKAKAQPRAAVMINAIEETVRPPDVTGDDALMPPTAQNAAKGTVLRPAANTKAPPANFAMDMACRMCSTEGRYWYDAIDGLNRCPWAGAEGTSRAFFGDNTGPAITLCSNRLFSQAEVRRSTALLNH